MITLLRPLRPNLGGLAIGWQSKAVLHLSSNRSTSTLFSRPPRQPLAAVGSIKINYSADTANHCT